jgi:hypothetical protein
MNGISSDYDATMVATLKFDASSVFKLEFPCRDFSIFCCNPPREISDCQQTRNLSNPSSRKLFKIKTLNKVAKESDAEHNKIIKKKDNTIENLQHYKTLKTSEERELKIKDKKINKKLKSLGEREAQLVRAECSTLLI